MRKQLQRNITGVPTTSVANAEEKSPARMVATVCHFTVQTWTNRGACESTKRPTIPVCCGLFQPGAEQGNASHAQTRLRKRVQQNKRVHNKENPRKRACAHTHTHTHAH